MNALSRVRRVLFAMPALAALAAAGTMTAGTMRLPANDEATADDAVTVVTSDAGFFVASNCTYYNNALHTQVVGQFGYDCCNNHVAWGKKSPYFVCGGCFPCIPPPP